MKFVIQSYDRSANTWDVMGRMESKSFSQVVKRVTASVEKRRQSERILRKLRSGYRKLVTIKYGDNKKVVTTFEPSGMRLFDREKGVSDRYQEGIEEGEDAAYAEQDRAKAHIKGSKLDAIANYNRYWRDSSRFDRFSGRVPGIFQCQKCRFWFAKPSKAERPACPSCHSRDTIRRRGVR